MTLKYTVQIASKEQIYSHLKSCDGDFTPRLSSRVDLRDYAAKMFEKSVSFEAWQDNVLVGMINVYLDDVSCQTGFITNVSILKAYRGQGVASNLVAVCLEHSRNLSFTRIKLEVSRENSTALRLYSRAGFEVIGQSGENLLMEHTFFGQNGQSRYNHSSRSELPSEETSGAIAQKTLPFLTPQWKPKAMQSLDELAILGGTPAFTDKLHVGRPNIGERAVLLARINDLLDRRWLTNNGPLVQKFEQHIADFLGVKHCVAVCNATVALEVTARALELHGEVIVPSFTFIATPHALQWQQITPVFCDVDPDTHNIDPAKVEALITPRTTGILGVHVWGRPCAIEALHEIARRRGLKLMFDAAHAFGCSYRGRMIGNFGQAEVFSFHATKFFNTFEGGAVVTNDDELATKIRLMTNFGFNDYDSVSHIGTNGKMTEISAAMGLTGLESLDEFIATNRRNYAVYRGGLQDLPGIQCIGYDENECSNYQYVIVEVDQALTGISRDDLVRVLHAENVLARRYFYPGCHQMEPYRSQFPHAGLHLPETERLTHRVMSLPTGTAVGLPEINRVCELVRFAIAHGPELSSRLTLPQLELGLLCQRQT